MKNTSTCGTVLTEYPLKTSRRSHSTKAVRKILRESLDYKQDKGYKKIRNEEGTYIPGREL